MGIVDEVACVVIGRNEGARLRRCLEVLSTTGVRFVYVDSGSTDGSLDTARALSLIHISEPTRLM
jgi:glycosyltransferase involved in cell wall biosynthesis